MRTFYNGKYSNKPAIVYAQEWANKNAWGPVCVRVAVSEYGTSYPKVIEPIDPEVADYLAEVKAERDAEAAYERQIDYKMWLRDGGQPDHAF